MATVSGLLPLSHMLTSSYLYFDMPTMSLHAAPSVPLNLTFIPGGVLNDSITLTWLTPQRPNGVIRLYELQWSSSGSVFNINTTDNTNTTALSDLTPGTQYNFSVRAFTVAFGPFSAQLILHTADGENTCSTFCDTRNALLYNRELTRGQSHYCGILCPSLLIQCPQCLEMSMSAAMDLLLCL